MKYSDLISRGIYKLSEVALIALNHASKFRGNVWMIHHVGNGEGEFTISSQNLENFLIAHQNNAIPILNIGAFDRFDIFTIDDVSSDFYCNGFPLFIKYKIPFTIFVCVELLDKPGYLSTEQLAEICQSPLCTIGSHGLTHSFYKLLDKEEKMAFLDKSKQILEDICKTPIDVFAFPYGSLYACGFSDKSFVSKFYKYGFGTIPTPVTTKGLRKSFFLPRLNLNNDCF